MTAVETAPADFTCAQCGQTFTKGWSDEDAAKEADELWGDDLVDPVVVCDDCFQAMQAAYPISDYRGSVAESIAKVKRECDEWYASLTPAEKAKSDFHQYVMTQSLFYGKVDMDEASRLLTLAVIAQIEEKA